LITSALKHVRSNIVAYIALFVALGGTSYAAINLPAGSVGSKQLQNRVIASVKFNPRFINGTIRAWAVVAPDGKVQESAGKPTVVVGTGVQGLYVIKWKNVAAPTRRGCFAAAGLTDQAQAGSAQASLGFSVKGPKVWAVDVNTYGAQGQRLEQDFYATVIC
jgi:hypothetical protein